MSDRLTPASESLLRDMNRHDRGWARERLHTVEAEAAARALDEVLSVENVARALDTVNAANVRIIDSRDYATALIAALRGDR